MPFSLYLFVPIKSLSLLNTITSAKPLHRSIPDFLAKTEREREKKVQEVKTQKMRPKIFLFGDSITEESFSDGGWGASLADLLRRKV